MYDAGVTSGCFGVLGVDLERVEFDVACASLPDDRRRILNSDPQSKGCFYIYQSCQNPKNLLGAGTGRPYSHIA